MVDDFLYICDDAYNRMEFVRMEKDILRTVDFNLGMPISYRFLRRLAKVSRCLAIDIIFSFGGWELTIGLQCCLEPNGITNTKNIANQEPYCALSEHMTSSKI